MRILEGDALTCLRKLADESVQCCVTSPPYWGLRDYGTGKWEGGKPGCDHAQPAQPHRGLKNAANRSDGCCREQSGPREAKQPIAYTDICGKCGARRVDAQLGLERTPEEYVAHLVAVFREVRRVLRADGTLWLNVGDSYNSRNKQVASLKPKDLVGIPWRVAFALQADGWYLRSDIIWHKPNPMPESVTDRPTKAHEYLFLLSKSARYYYDSKAIAERSESAGKPLLITSAQANNAVGRKPIGNQNPENYRKPRGETRNRRSVWTADAMAPEFAGKNRKLDTQAASRRMLLNMKARREESGEHDLCFGPTRNRRSVWTISTKPYKGAHFATFPPKLIEPAILAGCPEGGVVLDPFAGVFTTPMVAQQHGRDFIAIELNREYVAMGIERLNQSLAKAA